MLNLEPQGLMLRRIGRILGKKNFKVRTVGYTKRVRRF